MSLLPPSLRGRETGFVEEGDGTSRLRTEGVGEEGVYKCARSASSSSSEGRKL